MYATPGEDLSVDQPGIAHLPPDTLNLIAELKAIKNLTNPGKHLLVQRQQ